MFKKKLVISERKLAVIVAHFFKIIVIVCTMNEEYIIIEKIQEKRKLSYIKELSQ